MVNLQIDCILDTYKNNRSSFYAVLDAIVQEFRTIEEITKFTCLRNDQVVILITCLISSGFISKKISSTSIKVDANYHKYDFIDPYLRYFFTFLHAKDPQTSFDHGFITRIEELIISKYTWPVLCVDWMDGFMQENGLTCDIDRMIIEWDESGKICHVIKEDPVKRIAVIGGCFSKNVPVTDADMLVLVKQGSKHMQGKDDWAVHLILFSISGFTSKANHLSSTLRMRLKGENIDIVSCRNVILSEI